MGQSPPLRLPLTLSSFPGLALAILLSNSNCNCNYPCKDDPEQPSHPRAVAETTSCDAVGGSERSYHVELLADYLPPRVSSKRSLPSEILESSPYHSSQRFSACELHTQGVQRSENDPRRNHCYMDRFLSQPWRFLLTRLPLWTLDLSMLVNSLTCPSCHLLVFPRPRRLEPRFLVPATKKGLPV